MALQDSDRYILYDNQVMALVNISKTPGVTHNLYPSQDMQCANK